jgi:hypothetical protein
MDALIVSEVKKQLPQNSYHVISKMLNGKYTPGTIRAMFRDRNYPSSRTMQPEVLAAAEKFIEMMNPVEV